MAPAVVNSLIILVLTHWACGIPKPFQILPEFREKQDTDDLSTNVPRDVIPLEYSLEIRPVIDAKEFHGKVTVKLLCQEETDKVTFHMHPVLRIASSEITMTTLVRTTPAPYVNQNHHADHPAIASVPVGAARLLPFSSSFVPDNGCTSFACAGSQSVETPELVEQSQEGQSEVSAVEITTAVEKTVHVKLDKVERNMKRQWLVLYVNRHLQRGETYTVELQFSGDLTSDHNNGIYMETYTDLTTGQKRKYVATRLQNENARKVFPCFDEPSFKVPVKISIAAPRDYMVLSNMREESLNDRGDLVWHNFQVSPAMSSFSVGFVIFNLDLLAFDDDAGIRLYGRQELIELPSTKRALELAVLAKEKIALYLDRVFPLPKIDIIILPGANSYAESNWGLIFLRESHLTCEHCLSQQITRDIAYQWFGHYVSPHWLEMADINRALATYVAFIAELKIVNTTSPSSRMWFMNYPLYYEYGKRTQYTHGPLHNHPLRSITMELVLRMFNYTLSSRAFQNALTYLACNRAYKTYQAEDVWSALTVMADGSLPGPGTVNQIAQSWLTMPRIPYIKVTRDYEKFSAEVEQHPFHLETSDDESDGNEIRWWIPITIVSQNNLQFTNLRPVVWMEEEPRIVLNDLPSASYFIIVNPEEVGPFLVNYDRKNWYLIAEYLERNINNEQIPAGTRAKLVHDSLSLAFAGKLRIDSALNVSRFLVHERDPIVWQAAFNLFDHISRQLEGSKTALKLQEYLRVLITPAYENLVNKTGPQTAAEERMMSNTRSILCSAGYKPCVDEAQKAWNTWMISPEPDAGIPINLSHFCTVFKYGTNEEWEFGLQRFKNYPRHMKETDRYYLLKSLVGCPSSPLNVEWLLNKTLLSNEEGIYRYDNVRLLLSSISSNVGYTALFHILEDNWDELKATYNRTRLWESMISTATMNFKTQEGLEMVTDLAQQRQGEFGTAAPIIDEAIKKLKRHVKWSEDNGVIIDQWLDNYLFRRRGI